jgi:hypothetical protein
MNITVWNSEVIGSLHLDFSFIPAPQIHKMPCIFLEALALWHEKGDDISFMFILQTELAIQNNSKLCL